ncbi:MAG: transcription antitermination protein nusG [Candidatus Acidoferrum typicum]|jgi:transcription antitermination factor NusG|nr:transcription antitermination protein nusG [Candidatus Acidoferrum typicum]
MLWTPTKSQDDHFDSPSSWYALYTRHHHEKTVARILTSKGFEIFLPLYSTAHNWKDRTKLVSLPLFPCYVFLKGGLERRLGIVTTPGVHALVSSAGQPAAISHAEIEGIRRAIESGVSIEPHPLLKCGDCVRVNSGALEGIQGILVRKKNLYRLVLSVGMLGKAASVEIDALLVERVNAAPSRKDPSTHITKPQLHFKGASYAAFAGS